MALFLAAASVVSGFAVWYLDIASKRLTVSLVSTTALGSGELSSFKDVRLTLADQTFTKPQLTVLKLQNTGLKEIRSADFEAPLSITLISSGRIVAAAQTGAERDQLPAAISARENKAEIAALLLNRSDAVHVALLTDGEAPKFRVNVRVAGIPEPVIDLIDPQEKRHWGAISSKFLIMLISLSLFIYVWVFVDPRSSDLPFKTSIVFPPRARTGATLVLMFAAIGPPLIVLKDFNTGITGDDLIALAWILGTAALSGAIVISRSLRLGTHQLPIEGGRNPIPKE